MDEFFDIPTLIVIGVAIFVLFRLRQVLGSRTGTERTPLQRAQQQPTQKPANDEKVVQMRPVPVPPVSDGDAERRALKLSAEIEQFAHGNAEVAAGLNAIGEADPTFGPKSFMEGAKQAYEMIVTAFAEGNRKLLKDLLSRDVYEGFTRAITDRESREEQVDQSFVGIDKADILDSEVKSGIASITVRFVSQLISATRDKAGAIISGDPQRIKEVTDIWTFSRDISSAKARANPNWRLIATQSPA